MGTARQNQHGRQDLQSCLYREIRSQLQRTRRRNISHLVLRLRAILRNRPAASLRKCLHICWIGQVVVRFSDQELFAVRRGVLKFRGYKPKRTPVNPAGPPTDADFDPDFEQKGVDMRIGLDIASYSANRCIDRIILVTNDTDCVPAMKYGRKSGLQTVITELPNGRTAPELRMHADFMRTVAWP